MKSGIESSSQRPAENERVIRRAFLSGRVGERVDALVDMNNPGVWVLGAIDDEAAAHIPRAHVAGRSLGTSLPVKPLRAVNSHRIFPVSESMGA